MERRDEGARGEGPLISEFELEAARSLSQSLTLSIFPSPNIHLCSHVLHTSTLPPQPALAACIPHQACIGAGCASFNNRINNDGGQARSETVVTIFSLKLLL
ncbi:hypothetical protein VPH35_072976 [Triticum aestivum]